MSGTVKASRSLVRVREDMLILLCFIYKLRRAVTDVIVLPFAEGKIEEIIVNDYTLGSVDWLLAMMLLFSMAMMLGSDNGECITDLCVFEVKHR